MKSKIHQLLILLATILNASMALALGPDTADVHFSKYSNPINITVSQGGSKGCPAGQHWDINVGGCTTAVTLRKESTSRSCGCTCPGSGSCTSSQSGTYPVYGWRIPTAGKELISGYGSTSWGACQMVTNSCQTDGGDSGGGGGGGSLSPGQQLLVKILVCGPGDLNYGSGPLDSSWKSTIISSYRSFNIGSRCPEPGGFITWQRQIISDAAWMYPDLSKTDPATAYAKAWAEWTRPLMFQIAFDNGENTPAYLSKLDSWCTTKIKTINPALSGRYINGSGNTCIAY